jgi:NAD(P)-dependent dehydrogenase (short-subunit alcohol dehydrogenase family)
MENVTLNHIENASNCLQGQVLLITGASQGIGRALALSAAKHGATTILLGKSLKKLESLYDEIVQAGYPEPAIHPLNLLRIQPKDAYELAQSIQGMFSRLDGLIHNAAVTAQICEVELLQPEKWQEAIHVNLNAPYLLTHALLPLLKQSTNSSILFTTADESLKGKAYWSAYSASKFGLLGLAQSLHHELETNTDIRVNCINPGKVRTSLRIGAYPGIDPNSLPLPEEILTHYLYLLSPHAKHVRGKWVNAQVSVPEVETV